MRLGADAKTVDARFENRCDGLVVHELLLIGSFFVC